MTPDLHQQPRRLETCIYCQAPLPSKNREHVFPSNVMGRHSTSRVICDECNAYFSSSKVDEVFKVYTQFLMGPHKLLGDRHKKSPTFTPNSVTGRGQLSTNVFMEYRFAVHTALKCMALFDPDFSSLVPQRTFDFARHGSGDWRDFSLRGSLIVEDMHAFVDEATSYDVPAYNVIHLLYSGEKNCIIARMILLGTISRWFMLSRCYEGPDKSFVVFDNTRTTQLHGYPADSLHEQALSSVVFSPVDVFQSFGWEMNQLIQGHFIRGSRQRQCVDAAEQLITQYKNKLTEKFFVRYVDALYDGADPYWHALARHRGVSLFKVFLDLGLDVLLFEWIDKPRDSGFDYYQFKLLKVVLMPEKELNKIFD